MKNSKQLDSETLFNSIKKYLKFTPDLKMFEERTTSLVTKGYLWKVDK